MHLSDLQTKDVVNINDGKKIGRIIDAAINDAGIIENSTFLLLFLLLTDSHNLLNYTVFS